MWESWENAVVISLHSLKSVLLISFPVSWYNSNGVFVLSSLLNKQFVVELNKAWGALWWNTCVVVHLPRCRSKEQSVFCVKQIVVFRSLWRSHEVREDRPRVSLWAVLCPAVLWPCAAEEPSHSLGGSWGPRAAEAWPSCLWCMQRKEFMCAKADQGCQLVAGALQGVLWKRVGGRWCFLFCTCPCGSVPNPRQFNSSLLCLTNTGR